MRGGGARWRVWRALLLAAIAAAPVWAADPPQPTEAEGSGWMIAGTRPQDYAVELEPSGGRKGTLAASLRAIASTEDGFVTLMRWVQAAPYAGQRLRLAAWVKSEAVAGWAGLWMRVDTFGSERTLAFDNMEHRAIRGTGDWRRYEVVLDVDPRADRVFYGVILSGSGRVWVDDFQLEPVGKDVPTTERPFFRPRPLNLDFDHPEEAEG